MRKPLEIPIPAEDELEALETLYQTTREVRLRTRAQMVLLAAEQHLTAPAIAKIVREDDQTVRNWLKRWRAEGIDGLRDRPKPRVPPKVTTGYKEQLLAAVRRRPRSLGLPYSIWTLQRLADYMAEQTGIRVSAKTVHKLLKNGELVLSRPQHKITSPGPESLVKKDD
jgi:transposase